MLYLSTRNPADAYTAYRALHEERTPDGGFFVPLQTHVFSQDDLHTLKGKTQGEVIALVLNRFFGSQLCGWDVERVVGRIPLKPETVNQKILFAECWRNPTGSVEYLISTLYDLLCENEAAAITPFGWVRICVEIALLFAIYATTDWSDGGMDIAVAAGDFAEVCSALYAKEMGLPLNTLICTSNSNSGTWDLINKGEFNTNASVIPTQLPKLDISRPCYMEFLLYRRFGKDEVEKYLDCCNRKVYYRLDESQLQVLNQDIFASVVSADRADSIVNGLVRTNGYTVDAYTALAYGGLQDYRAHTGINRDTLILALYRPQRDKE